MVQLLRLLVPSRQVVVRRFLLSASLFAASVLPLRAADPAPAPASQATPNSVATVPSGAAQGPSATPVPPATVSAEAAAAEAEALFVATHAVQPDSPAILAWAEGLGKLGVLRADFQQTKYLKVLRRPLLSSGELLVAPGVGLLWHTKAPFDSRFILHGDAMAMVDAKGTVTRVPDGGNTTIQALRQVLPAVFSQDLVALHKHFDLYLQPTDPAVDGGSWQLGLSARNPDLQKLMTRIILRGTDTVDHVTIHEANGDRAEIRLTGTERRDGPPTDEERAALAF